ncbi:MULTISPECIES: aminopeptidase P family protein [Metallosphaera]|uniref:Peptidase M24 n=3 Tax=Metallosphaera TaxID=41980 RepID=A4YH63_METS5|nr:MULTISPECIES: aminopeptidase P family protein [Metallosphaera]ABP95765.1 peptidase M24 [Metallosphaera sedula DSM 5348]AIM27749.1 peptidase M24 [Metallosphaera sedula]AKV74607.1 peptidase M24 [Metallosphaera sedula]AKV76845.1 peptidase M24 [Metallosphaera sedula]AKV79096.1 peptidase M24 [Metallosphaera sedula]
MRLNKLEKIKEKSNAKNLLIVGEPNLFYFTGYRGVGGLLDCDGTRTLLVPLLERNRALGIKDLDVKVYYPVKLEENVIEGTLVSAVEKLCPSTTDKKLLIDLGYASVDLFLQLSSKYEAKNITEDILQTRAIKEEKEIEAIRHAQRATAMAMKMASESLVEGISEIELAGIIDETMRKGGAEDYAFPSIVAFGENSAEPHHIPCERRLRKGDTVVVDIGAKYNGYSFDSTRTFLYGITEKSKRIYDVVLEAQLEAIDAVQEGIEASQIDRIARSRIEKEGFGKLFVHSTGHGVGIEVHESPAISMKSKDILREGMVITVEPGIYFQGELGVRIEDTILVRKGKPEVLETLYKTL